MLPACNKAVVGILIAVLSITSTSACRPLGQESDVETIGPEKVEASFPKDFFFGVATAPAHVEDQLDDIWLEFAKKGEGVKAWKNAGYPELRLNFWSKYREEIDLAKELGTQVFRLGVDWGRLVPEKPALCQSSAACPTAKLDPHSLAHYRQIIKYVRSVGMTPMLTIYHHSLPKWLQELRVDAHGKANNGGWTNPDSLSYFTSFASGVVEAFASDVDVWVIFNEPAVFAALAYGAGIWPPAKGMNYSAMIDVKFYSGSVYSAMDRMIAAHNEVYKIIKKMDRSATGDPFTSGPATVGIAHNVAHYTGANPIGKMVASASRAAMNYRFLDGVIENLDFLGLNYYGEEYFGAPGLIIDPKFEYSESGRAINAQGFYLTLKDIHARYNAKRPNIPYIITENGISDSTDILRAPYLIEHLVALQEAMREGINVGGYIHWTLSDNWEWADGYCPKFGLASVNRATPALTRSKRPSFGLYQRIIQNHSITASQRAEAWNTLEKNVGRTRPMCRSSDGVKSLDTPSSRAFVSMDWRFKNIH